MNYHCQIETRPEQQTVAVRTHTPVTAVGSIVGHLYGQVMQYVGAMGAQPAVRPLSWPITTWTWRIWTSQPVSPWMRAPPARREITGDVLPAGDYATCMHVGPYDQVGPAYGALTEFVQQQGRTPTGVAYEFYFNSPEDTPPAQLQTLVLYPLQEGARCKPGRASVDRQSMSASRAGRSTQNRLPQRKEPLCHHTSFLPLTTPEPPGAVSSLQVHVYGKRVLAGTAKVQDNV